MTYEERRAALDLFDLDEGAILAEIKQRHRELSKRHHPDQRLQYQFGNDPLWGNGWR